MVVQFQHTTALSAMPALPGKGVSLISTSRTQASAPTGYAHFTWQIHKGIDKPQSICVKILHASKVDFFALIFFMKFSTNLWKGLQNKLNNQSFNLISRISAQKHMQIPAKILIFIFEFSATSNSEISETTTRISRKQISRLSRTRSLPCRDMRFVCCACYNNHT